MSSTSTARVDPAGDIETVNTELILADLQTVEQRSAQTGQGGPGPARNSRPRWTPSRPRSEILSDGRTIRVRRPAGEVDPCSSSAICTC